MDWDSTCLGCSNDLVYRFLPKLFWKGMSRGSEGEKGIDVRELGNGSVGLALQCENTDIEQSKIRF